MSKQSDREFLKSYWEELRETQETLDRLSSQDVETAKPDIAAASAEERCADIADESGFDGSVFRDVRMRCPDTSDGGFNYYLVGLSRQIEMIPQIIRTLDEHESTFLTKRLGEPPTPLQMAIWKALDGKAMTGDRLAVVTGYDKSCLYDIDRLNKKGGVSELREKGLVKNKPTRGYYRPDALPEETQQLANN